MLAYLIFGPSQITYSHIGKNKNTEYTKSKKHVTKI